MDETVVNPDVPLEDEVIDGGNLPSSVEESQLNLEGFTVNDEIMSKYFKNGKLMGRFDKLEDFIAANKSVEDKYSSLMRDIKNGKYQEVHQDTNTQTKVDEATLYEVATPLAQKFVEGGMELTDDIIAEATAKGLDIRDVKLAAIELKEQVQKAYSLVGGQEEYNAMLSWAKDSLNDSQKKAFDTDLKKGMGEWAIKGLYSEYSKAKSSDGSAQEQRIMGDSNAPVSQRGYASQAEMMKDRAYLNSPKGRNDTAAWSLHQARLAKTSDAIVYGR